MSGRASIVFSSGFAPKFEHDEQHIVAAKPKVSNRYVCILFFIVYKCCVTWLKLPSLLNIHIEVASGNLIYSVLLSKILS